MSLPVCYPHYPDYCLSITAHASRCAARSLHCTLDREISFNPVYQYITAAAATAADSCRNSSVEEQLPCKQQARGSNPRSGSTN